MPEVPAGITSVVVTGRYIRPDGTPLSGTITFEPPAHLTIATADTISVGAATATLDAYGAVSIALIATDDPSTQPSDWTYTVVERLRHAEGRTYHVSLPGATPIVDLADIAPTAPADGEYVVVTGPAGKDGSQIYSGTGAPPTTTGVAGDYYIDTTTGAVQLYGPKSSSGWPTSGVTLGSGNLVTSVNGYQGAVALTAADVSAVSTTNGKTSGNLLLDGTAGTYRAIRLQSSNVDRWQIQNDGISESGAGAGSNLRISARNDDGTDAGLAVYISRATRRIAFGGSSLFGDAQVTSYGGVGIRDSASDPATAASGVQVYSKGGLAYVRQGDGTIGSVGSVALTKSQVFPAPAGAVSYVVWRAPKACTVTAVRGYRVGGTGATVNASKGASNLLASDLSLTTADSWISSTSLQNATFAAGDTLILKVVTVAGSPSAVTVQVDITQVA